MSTVSAFMAGLIMIGLVALLVRNARGVASIINAIGSNYAGVLGTAGGLPTG
jgi:hypothetical protein